MGIFYVKLFNFHAGNIKGLSGEGSGLCGVIGYGTCEATSFERKSVTTSKARETDYPLEPSKNLTKKKVRKKFLFYRYHHLRGLADII